jgi:hypothetical protein
MMRSSTPSPAQKENEMDEEYQRMTANSIAHEAFCAGQAWQQAAAAQERPSVLWKPSLFRDGNQWCALLGENIQDGVVGFGDSPDAAMWAFDEAWREKLPPAPSAQPAPSVTDGWQLVVKDLIREIERQTCAHEETHRAGFLLEICDSCGAKWADDEGGKPEFKWPKCVERARAMLAAAPEKR